MVTGSPVFKLLLVALSAAPCVAFALQPCSTALPEYRNNVRRAVEAASPGDYTLQIISLPSFSPESAIRLQRNTISYIEFGSSMWYQGKARDGVRPLRGTKVTHATLPADMVDAIRTVLVRHIQAATPSDSFGLDGETYTYEVPGVGCAETWSPDRGTMDANLVELIRLLKNAARAANARERRTNEGELATLLIKL